MKNKENKILIFCGGPSLEREISIKSSENIKKELEKNFNNITMIFVQKNLDWITKEGQKIKNIETFLKNFDIAINYIHGEYGEDGILQEILEKNKIIFLGSSSKSLKNTIRKDITRDICIKNNIPVAQQLKISKNDEILNNLEDIFKKLNTEKVIIKPSDSGSSFGISVANNIEELKKSINNALAVSDIIVIENFITGKEFSCGVYFNVEKQKNIPLPVVEIKYPSSKDFFDYEAKYEGLSEEICPAEINKELSEKIKKIAVKTFEATKCSDFSRIDFLVDKKNNIFVVEINTIPGFTNESIFPKELKENNINIANFLKNLIEYKISNKDV